MNITPIQAEETSIEYDAIDPDYSDKAVMIVINETEYYLPKSQIRLYLKSSKLYAPNWLLMEKDLI